MKRISIVAFCLAVLSAACGDAAFGQITVTGDTLGFGKPGTLKPRPGTYAMSTVSGIRWELTLTPAAVGDFDVHGFVRQVNVRNTIRGTLYGRNGHFRGTMYDAEGHEMYPIDGEWSGSGVRLMHFGGGESGMGVDLMLTPVRTRVAQPQGAAARKPQALSEGPGFGLVSKVLGHVPGPAVGNDSTASGSIDETSFSVEVRMKPPSTSFVSVTHHYTSQLSSHLSPGQIVELSCWSEAKRMGLDTPYVGSGCAWYVEGDGAAVTQTGKSFAGYSADGNFHPISERAITRFQVLHTGTIRITAGQGGALWGGSDNWNPVTYVYKVGARPATTVGAGR